jgi:hypothetical protein
MEGKRRKEEVRRSGEEAVGGKGREGRTIGSPIFKLKLRR